MLFEVGDRSLSVHRDPRGRGGHRGRRRQRDRPPRRLRLPRRDEPAHGSDGVPDRRRNRADALHRGRARACCAQLLSEDGSLADVLLSAFIRRREALQHGTGSGIEIVGPRDSQPTRAARRVGEARPPPARLERHGRTRARRWSTVAPRLPLSACPAGRSSRADDRRALARARHRARARTPRERGRPRDRRRRAGGARRRRLRRLGGSRDARRRELRRSAARPGPRGGSRTTSASRPGSAAPS